jgi:hypothetical protein
VSLTYAVANKYILWHETLHLLGVPDHYDLKTLRTTCGLATCVMQYGPEEGTVGDGRWLCEMGVVRPV